MSDSLKKILNDLSAVVSIAACVAALVLLAQPVNGADDPTPPSPTPNGDDMGACCYGARFEVLFITRYDCNKGIGSPSGNPGMFVNDAVPTAGVNPCDTLMGGD